VLSLTVNNKMLKDILGITRLEKQFKRFGKRLDGIEERLSKLEEPHKPRPETYTRDKNEILNNMKKPMTTTEVAEKLDKHRSWISLLINKLEREGKVYEKKRRGREIVYWKV